MRLNLDQEESKKSENAYQEIVQELNTVSESKLMNRGQLLIGAYKMAFSQFVTANDIFEKKWRVDVLSQILIDLLAAKADLEANQNEIIDSIRQNVLEIMKTMSGLHSERFRSRLCFVMLLTYIFPACGLLLNNSLDRESQICGHGILGILPALTVMIFINMKYIEPLYVHRVQMKPIMDELNIKTQQLVQTQTMSFILTSLIDEKFNRDYQQIVTDLNKQEATTPLRTKEKMKFVAIQRACSEDDQECPICLSNCQPSEAVYSMVETKPSEDSKEWPYQGFYHQDCLKKWIDNQNDNNYALIDPKTSKKLVLRLGFPLLISIQKIREDFSDLQRKYPVKPSYELNLSLRPIQNGVQMGFQPSSSDEQKQQEIRNRLLIFRPTTLTTTPPALIFEM